MAIKKCKERKCHLVYLDETDTYGRYCALCLDAIKVGEIHLILYTGLRNRICADCCLEMEHFLPHVSYQELNRFMEDKNARKR